MEEPAPLSPGARTTRIRVALVEDDPHYLLFLESELGASLRHEVVAVAGSAEAAMAWPAEIAPHVVLIDEFLPGRHGSQLVRDLLRKFPGALALMVTAVNDAATVLESIRHGAVGYVLKGTPASEIVAAIDEALAGGAPMTPAIARKVLGWVRQAPASAPDGAADLGALTARERDVLEGVAAGQTDKEVAERLGVSRSTVKNCLLSIYGKWRVSSRTEAAVKFVRGGGA